MAIYHLEAKVVSRGAGRSAVAASAYLSCSRLYNDYDGIQHDYTKKQGLLWQQVFLPEYALQEWQDREKLWNAVEEVETAKDSRLAREFVVALPIELSREQQIELLQDFIREQQYPYKVGRKKVYMTPSAAKAQELIRADKHPKSTRYGRQNPISER